MPYFITNDYAPSGLLGCGCHAPSVRIRLGEAAAAATFLRREDQPPRVTIYVSIPLGGEAPARPMTGIFVPANFRVEPQVDIILYLHGHHRKGPNDPPNQTIARYWNRAVHSYFDFREGLNASGKNVILVAPTLGPRSEAGRLMHPGGLDWYLNAVLAALRQHGPYPTAGAGLRIRNLILACHSGGGKPMRRLATLPSHNAVAIRECWGFDCLYNGGDEDAWARWARAHPSSRLFIHYGSGGTQTKSEALRRMRVPNVFVEGRTSLAHNLVPKTHWLARLRAATFLGST
jgi:hypothetical protein